MVKCPKCESFMTDFIDYEDDFCGTIAAYYECECGTRFHINHRADENIIIDQEGRDE